MGCLSGWVCEADKVEIEIETERETERGETERQVAAYGTERLDTETVCGDTDNGFGLLFNWNRLGEGDHTVVALVDGVELGRATVTVTTVGAGDEEEFLRAWRANVWGRLSHAGRDGAAGMATEQAELCDHERHASGWDEHGRGGRRGLSGESGAELVPERHCVISGWVCAAEAVEIEIETESGETERQVAAYGTERLDTVQRKDGTPLCGDTDNGFGLLFNWNRLGAGEHTVVAYVDDVD